MKVDDVPIRIRAKVTECTGNTRHSIGEIVDGIPIPVDKIPTASWIEIVEDEGAFFLYHFNEFGEVIADTWHENLKDAKSQAMFEFRISDSDWSILQDK